MPILTRPAAQSAFGQFRTLLGAPPEGETPAEIRENYRIKWAGFQLRHRNRLEAELARHGVALSEKGYGQVSFPSAPAMGEGGGRTTAREEAAAAPPERIAAVESKEDVGTQVRSSDDHYVSVMMLATLHIQLYFSQELDKKPLYFTRCIKPLLLLLGPDFEFYTLKISREGEGQVWQLPPTFRCFPPSIESHDRSLFLEMLALECPQLLVPTDGSVSFWGRAVIQHVESVSPSIPLGVFWGRVLTSFSPSVLPIIFDTPAFGDRLRAELTRLNGKPFAQYTFVQQFLEQEFPALSGRTDHRGMREWKSNVFEALQAMGFCTAPPEVLFDRQMERTAEGSTERAVVLREAAQGEWTFLTRLRADQFFQLAMSLPPSETRYQPPVRRGQSVGLRALDYLTSPWLSALNHWKSQASSNPEIRELLRGYILKLLTARSTADTNLHALALLTDEITPEWVNSRPEWNDPSQRLALYRRLTDVRVTDQEMSVLYSAGDATATAIDARWAAIFSMLKLTPAQWDAYLPTHWLDEDRPLFVRDEGSPDPDRFVPPHPSQETLTHYPSELSFVFTDMGVPLRFEYLDEIFKHYKNSPRIMERFVKEHRDFFAALPEEQRLEFLGALYQFIRLDAAKNLNAERIWRPFVDSLVPPVVGDMRWQEDPVTIAVPVSREAPDGVAYVNGFCRWSLEAVSRAHPKLWASSPREDGTESYAIQGRGYERKDCCGTDLACHRLGNHFDVWTTEEVVKVTRLALTPRFAEFMALWAHAPLVAHNLTIFSLGDERWRTYEGRRFRFYCIVGGESIEQLNRLARALYETGRFHEARACLDRATFVSNTLREWESVGDYTISGLPSVITLEHLPPIERPFSDVQDYFNRQWLNLIGTPATGGAEATGLYAEMDENTPAWKSVILGEGTVSATVRGIFQGVTAFGFENVLRRLDHLERLIELAQTGRITDFYKAKATSFTSLKVGGVHYSDVVMALPYHLFELPLQREAKLQWVREQRDRVWALYAALGGKNRARLERQLRAEEALPAAAAASAGAKPAMGGGGGGAAAAAGAGAPRASPAAAPAAAASAAAAAVAAAPAAAAPLDAAASAGSGSAAAAAGAFSMRQT